MAWEWPFRFAERMATQTALSSSIGSLAHGYGAQKLLSPTGRAPTRVCPCLFH